MWTLELSEGLDGGQRLILQISPKTPLIELASLVLSLNRLILSMLLVEQAQLDGDLPTDSDSNAASSILHNRLGGTQNREWDLPNWN